MTNANEHDEQQHRRQVADVVPHWMRRRGMARQIFADRLRKPLSWIDKIKVRCRQLTDQLVGDLVRSYPRGTQPPAPLVKVAQVVGVAV